jgi:hypothetical protein
MLHARIIDPDRVRTERQSDESEPLRVPSAQQRRPSPWPGMARSISLWAVAVWGLYRLADAIAAEMDSWLIGFAGAGLAALIVLAVLSPIRSRKVARRT